MTASSQTLTVRVPMTIRRQGGRKVIIAPDGGSVTARPPTRPRIDFALVKALARAHRWQAMLVSGRYASISEIAAAEKIDRGYVGSILRLTLLAPDIVELILDGRQPTHLGLPRLLQPFPLEWIKQRLGLLSSPTVSQAVIGGRAMKTPRRAAPSHMAPGALAPTGRHSPAECNEVKKTGSHEGREERARVGDVKNFNVIEHKLRSS